MTQEQIIQNAKEYIEDNLDDISKLKLVYEVIEEFIYTLDYTEYTKGQNRLITVNQIIKELIKNEK